MKKKPEYFLYHILESINEIERNIKDLEESEFATNVTIQDAVIRRLEIIGEATKNLPVSFKEDYPDVEWKKIAGLRDVIVHQYFGLSLKLIWRVINHELPDLKRRISQIIEPLSTQY